MARAVLERKLTEASSRAVEFAIATESDDADIRRLLRENPMSGRISISLEREPNYFADAHGPGERKQTVIARAGERLVCVGSCCIRKRFVNGAPRDVGYLGGLRLDAAFAGRFDILRRGYEFFQQTQSDAPADFYFTSIASDNEPARRILERGLRGMPAYEFVGEFVTILIPVRQTNATPRDGVAEPLSELIDFINAHHRTRQFAPCWTSEDFQALDPLGLRWIDCVALRDGNKIAGCGAIWDQRCFKQTIIRDYAPWIRRFRRPINAFNRIVGQPQLPKPGSILENAFACNLSVDPDAPHILVNLIRSLCEGAARRGVLMVALGFAANDPGFAIARKNFRFREYRSRIYLVRWQGVGRGAK